MHKTISEYEFMNDMFAIRPDNFTRTALQALFDYYTELEESDDQQIEFDPIAICCDWTEYDSLLEAYESYIQHSTETDDEMKEYFELNTTIIELENGHVLIMQF